MNNAISPAIAAHSRGKLQNMNEVERTPWYRTPLVWIMAGVTAWGLYLAIGGYLYGGRQAVMRGVLIFGCTLAFLLFWIVVLSAKRRRDNKDPS